MGSIGFSGRVLTLVVLTAVCACSQGLGAAQSLEPNPPPELEPVAASSEVPVLPSPEPSSDSNALQLDLLITKSMLYSAGLKHGVNPYLVMGLAWHESGWNPAAISSAGAIGIMQVMPATAAADGPALLHREVNLFDPADNIDMGTAILKNNLDHYHNDLAKALVAYYAGGGAVTDWSRLREDERRYVWSVYRNAIAFRDGKGPV
jgi:soluble lytic murein transglycosylase-like protein